MDDVLPILEKVPFLFDAQLWEIAKRCRIFRSRADGEDQTVELELSVDAAGRWMVVASDVERGIKLGADAYLVKPFLPPQLLETVRSVMAARASASSPGTPAGDT